MSFVAQICLRKSRHQDLDLYCYSIPETNLRKGSKLNSLLKQVTEIQDSSDFISFKMLKWFTFSIISLHIEYLIPVGTAEPDGSCKFTYRSVSRKMGRFNSPRHPANYPSSTNCTYIFLSTPQEQVYISNLLQFEIVAKGKYENMNLPLITFLKILFSGANCFR